MKEKEGGGGESKLAVVYKTHYYFPAKQLCVMR